MIFLFIIEAPTINGIINFLSPQMNHVIPLCVAKTAEREKNEPRAHDQTVSWAIISSLSPPDVYSCSVEDSKNRRMYLLHVARILSIPDVPSLNRRKSLIYKTIVFRGTQ